jgi:hypothetical protein
MFMPEPAINPLATVGLAGALAHVRRLIGGS